ncbi:hypothetical protein D3C77_395620 [compost metagenome]
MLDSIDTNRNDSGLNEPKIVVDVRLMLDPLPVMGKLKNRLHSQRDQFRQFIKNSHVLHFRIHCYPSTIRHIPNNYSIPLKSPLINNHTI